MTTLKKTRASRRAAIFTAAALLFPAGALGEDAAVKMIGPTELAEMLGHKDFFLVNVHVPYEGEIAQTDAMIPYDTIGKNLDKLPADRSAKIVVYCRSGGMSAVAAEELVRLGYTQVSDLIGGMIDWQQTGHEVIQK